MSITLRLPLLQTWLLQSIPKNECFLFLPSKKLENNREPDNWSLCFVARSSAENLDPAQVQIADFISKACRNMVSRQFELTNVVSFHF